MADIAIITNRENIPPLWNTVVSLKSLEPWYDIDSNTVFISDSAGFSFLNAEMYKWYLRGAIICAITAYSPINTDGINIHPNAKYANLWIYGKGGEIQFINNTAHIPVNKIPENMYIEYNILSTCEKLTFVKDAENITAK
jgi:hypothetical protein